MARFDSDRYELEIAKRDAEIRELRQQANDRARDTAQEMVDATVRQLARDKMDLGEQLDEERRRLAVLAAERDLYQARVGMAERERDRWQALADAAMRARDSAFRDLDDRRAAADARELDHDARRRDRVRLWVLGALAALPGGAWIASWLSQWLNGGR